MRPRVGGRLPVLSFGPSDFTTPVQSALATSGSSSSRRGSVTVTVRERGTALAGGSEALFSGSALMGLAARMELLEEAAGGALTGFAARMALLEDGAGGALTGFAARMAL